MAGVIPLDTSQQLRGQKKAVFFATAGEKGVIKVWRSDTATCVYTHDSPDGVGVAQNYVELALLPGGAGLLAASADARILFLQPQVRWGLSVHTCSTKGGGGSAFLRPQVWWE